MRAGTGPFTAFVFDLDGTLVDSRPAIEKAAQNALSEVVPDRRGVRVTAIIGPPIREMLKTALGEIDDLTLDRLVAAFRREYDSGIWRETAAYPRVIELLEEIVAQGASSFVLTNKPRIPTMKILRRLKIDRRIQEVVTPDSRRFPFTSKAEALSALMKRHKLARGTTLVVGDLPDDARAAEGCGVAFAAAIYGYGRWDQDPDGAHYLRIKSPSDLVPLVRSVL
jgi:phosphoglycolate phosphatase